jgi:hypothetical protein
VASKRKLKWLGVATAILVLCAAATWFLWPNGRLITADTYARLDTGMALAEVEGLLGSPGGTRQDFSLWLNNRSPTLGSGTDLLNGQRSQPGIRYWYQDSGVIIVCFDPDGRLADKQFLQVRVSTLRQQVNRLLERVGW